jgi:hypothetical protein
MRSRVNVDSKISNLEKTKQTEELRNHHMKRLCAAAEITNNRVAQHITMAPEDQLPTAFLKME